MGAFTNGKRIASDDRFLADLEKVRPSFYFQFDGFERETYRANRGERGVNEHEIGTIVDFAK